MLHALQRLHAMPTHCDSTCPSEPRVIGSAVAEIRPALDIVKARLTSRDWGFGPPVHSFAQQPGLVVPPSHVFMSVLCVGAKRGKGVSSTSATWDMRTDPTLQQMRTSSPFFPHPSEGQAIYCCSHPDLQVSVAYILLQICKACCKSKAVSSRTSRAQILAASRKEERRHVTGTCCLPVSSCMSRILFSSL